MSQKSGRQTKMALASKPAPVTGQAKPRAKRSAKDVVLIHGVSESGEMAVIRAREDRVEAGLVRPIREGEPLTGEVIKLKPRAEFPLLCDVDVEVPRGMLNAPGGGEQAARAHKGPAQVATKAYRDNWESIWQRPRRGAKPN